MKKIYYILICIFATSLVAFGQGSPSNLPADISSSNQTVSPTSTQNYIVSYTYLQPKTTHSSNYNTGETSPEIQYFDGLGRPVETVSVRASQLGKDMITYQKYDSYGRPYKQYLPYGKSSNNGAFVSESSFTAGQSSFLTGIYGSTDGNKGFAETDYEASPLNRVLKQGAPGDDWQLDENSFEYAYKTNTSSISSWKYTGTGYSSFSYAANTLYINETTDEDGNIINEYIDFEGKIIQKVIINGPYEYSWLITRYCYDEFGLLRCVVQPEGSSPSNTNYCFYYKYDERKRLTDKYIPGGSWIYYIYDVRDRIVLTQDGNQRGKSPDEWTYTVYDGVNRPIETGGWPTNTSRSSLDSTMSFASNLNYIDNQPGKYPLKQMYYDDYTNCPSANNFHSSDASTLQVTQATTNTGRLTWEVTYNYTLGYESGMTYNLDVAYYYDKYGRLIQSVADNHLGGTNYITTSYNFIGQDIRTRSRHVADGTTTYTDQYMDYDHRGRVVKIRHSINGSNEKLLAGFSYDETGQIIDKYLHSENNGNFLQKLDYKYNIRGWLTEINNPSTFSENDKFGLQLNYNTAPTGGSALYNGNISGMKWGTPSNPNMLYRFTYDYANRLTKASFYKSGYATLAFYTEYSYTKNGNFADIDRRKLNGGDLDYLVYEYDGNRIDYIDDYSEDVANVIDYPGVVMGDDVFEYDDNGNVTYEPYKQIIIDYNLLNLPSIFDFGSNKKIKNFYTFDGMKTRNVVEDNGTITKTDYCGAFIYETVSGTRSLKYITTPEGRAVKNGSSWDYEYNLTDHLGNVRAVIHKGAGGLAEVLQEKHYYPFGMEMSELSSGAGTNKYLYNGKELQNDFDLYWYDYGARFYDPALARFHTVDPISENYYFQSPYAYAANNPITFIDYNGLGPWDYVKGIGIGIGSGAKGTWNFATSGAWKADTWKATGNLALGMAAMGPNGTGAGNLVALDAALGTNTAGAVGGLSTAIDQGVDKFVNGSDQDRGEIIGEVIWGVAEGVAGSKGAGMLTKTGGAAAKLKLPASMVDELSIYKAAAKNGSLVKTSTKGTASKARKMWEKANGPVPDGYDVDHIIQRQFGGVDDISNFQLKKSGLNRSEGSKGYHLNKQHPHGTKFKEVELDN